MFYIYMVFIVSIFIHLPSRIPPLGFIRFDMLLYGILSVGVIVHSVKIIQRPSSELTKKLLILVAYIIITIPLVKWPGSVLRENFLTLVKVIVFYFFTLSFVTSESRLKIFMAVFLGCQIFRAVEPAFLHITTGYWGSSAHSLVGGFTTLDRLSGAPHDVVNPNQLAWVIVNTVPFIYFLMWKSRSNLLKIISIALVPTLLYPLFLTASRTGLIILIVVILAILLMEGLKLKVIVTASIILIPSGIIISGMLSPGLSTRYLSIFDSTLPGADTAQGRFSSMVRIIEHMSGRAVFGHGLGTSPETNFNIVGGQARRTHNMYVEAIQEIGFVGLMILLYYIFTMFKTAAESAKRIQQSGLRDYWLWDFASALKAWILMNLVYCLACFALTHWEWYLFGGLTAACANLVADRIEDLPQGEQEYSDSKYPSRPMSIGA